ncbi:MAG: GNAT family N-acetyltransferase [Flavobacteriales bacterium]|nr:GNAT family N-acetyltransferase [Flavobacteriales bacterium]
MLISGYNIQLTLLKESNLEMVRLWRNMDEVKEYMEFREHISSSKQKKWFKELDNLRNKYFVIKYEKENIGLIHIKNIDFDTLIGEAGIFIGVSHYVKTMVPMQAILCLMDFAFFELKLKSLKAKVKNENEKAFIFNKELGYEKEQKTLNGFTYLEVDKVRYLKKNDKVRTFYQKRNLGIEVMSNID